MENFLLAGTEVVVAVSTQATSIHDFGGMLTVVSHLRATLDVIAIVTHPFGMMRLVCVRTIGYFLPSIGIFFEGLIVALAHSMVILLV
jgi:hypothetical protein